MRHVLRAYGTRITGLWRSLALAGWLWLAQLALAGWLWLELELALAGSGSGSGCQGGRTAAQAWAGLGAWAGWWLAWPGGWLSPGLAAGAWLVAWQEAPAFCSPKRSTRPSKAQVTHFSTGKGPMDTATRGMAFQSRSQKMFFHRKRSLVVSQKRSKKPSRARINHFPNKRPHGHGDPRTWNPAPPKKTFIFP